MDQSAESLLSRASGSTSSVCRHRAGAGPKAARAFSMIFVLINLLVDLLYFAVDPRLRIDGSTAGH